MSVVDLKIETTRCNQGESLRSKDWELVRKKVFQEEDLLWNDSQFNINEAKDEEKSSNLITALQNQEKNMKENNQLKQQQIRNSNLNNNSRRLNIFSKRSSSRSRIIELDISNINEVTYFNKLAKEEMLVRDKTNSIQNTKQNANKINKLIEWNKYLYKTLFLISKIKVKMRNFYYNFTSIKRSRLLNRDIRLLINDQSDIIEAKENYFKICLQKIYKNYICRSFKIPLFSISSRACFYMKLTLVLLSITYLYLLSIFIVFQVDDDFSNLICQIINFVWLIDFLFSINSQSQEDTQIIRNRGKAMMFYLKEKLIYDLIPIILNSQLVYKKVMIIRIFQFLKLINITSDLKYIQLQLNIRVSRGYIIQVTNLILRLFIIGHTIACLWYLIGYIEITYLGDQNSWLAQEQYKDKFWWQIYFSALYWSLTLMSTGSNVCSADLEIMFITFMILFSGIVFGYLITIIGDILSEINTKEVKRKQDTNVINNYMRQTNISKELQANVNLYLQQYYQNNFLEEQQNNQVVLDKLPADLKECLKREQFKSFVDQIEVLFNKVISKQTLIEITLFMQEEFYFPNQKLNLSNDQSLIFITQGQLAIFQNEEQANSNKDNQLEKLNVGSHFGLIDFISGVSSQKSSKSTMFTKIVKIKRSDFLQVLQKSDLEYQKFCELKDKIQFYSEFRDINLKCNVCRSYNHLERNCDLININRKQIYYKQKINQEEKQQRINFKRFNVKNYNALLIIQNINEEAQKFIGDVKKHKDIDIIEQLNLTVSETDESFSAESNQNEQIDINQEEQQKDFDSQNYIQSPKKQVDQFFRKRSTLGRALTNKYSFKDLDQEQQQKQFDSVQVLKYDFPSDKLIEQANEPINKQISLTLLNENHNQRVIFKDIDKKNNNSSDDKNDGQSYRNQGSKQMFQIPSRDTLNQIPKYQSRLSCIVENQNQENSQSEQYQKQIHNSFKMLSQIFQFSNTLNHNHENNTHTNTSHLNIFKKMQNFLLTDFKKSSIQQIQLADLQFDAQKDFENYFILGNFKEIQQAMIKQMKKKVKRVLKSFYVQQKN